MLSLSKADRKDVDALRQHQASLLAAEGAARQQLLQEQEQQQEEAADLRQQQHVMTAAAASAAAEDTFQRPRTELEKMLLRKEKCFTAKTEGIHGFLVWDLYSNFFSGKLGSVVNKSLFRLFLGGNESSCFLV